MWMTVGDPRRRYPIRPSNDRLPCFSVSTAPAFPLARAGSTKGRFLGLRFSAPQVTTEHSLYLAVVITDQDDGTCAQERRIHRSDVQATIIEMDSSFAARGKKKEERDPGGREEGGRDSRTFKIFEDTEIEKYRNIENIDCQI